MTHFSPRLPLSKTLRKATILPGPAGEIMVQPFVTWMPWHHLHSTAIMRCSAVSIRARMCLALSAACMLGLALLFHSHPGKLAIVPAYSGDQGCVNQGRDHRIAGTVVCWAQRHLSWKSDREPRFVLIGRAESTSLGLAWPPYFVYNSPHGSGHWHMFRIGVRYDRNWRGYIFPTVAWKCLPQPLRY